MTVHTFDLHFQNTPGLIAAYLLECGGELALVETGPGATLATLRAAIRERGFEEKDVRHVFVTHIHLDHAGAAGWWAQQGAQVYCHPNAVRHLTDPSKLIESAHMIYGAQMDSLWGDVLPAPTGRVTALADGETVTVGDTPITAWDTPGHARHHHAFVAGKTCFTGDVAGLRLENCAYLSVTAAPPQFDPVAYEASVDRLAAAGFERLYLTHFGEITDVAWHLGRYRERIQEVLGHVQECHKTGLLAEQTQKLYRNAEHAVAAAAGVTEVLWEKHEMSNSTAMCADGIRLYVEKNP